MSDSDKAEWRTYEEVAAHLLNRIAYKFGLEAFEGKQIVPGDSGARWEIDAKGVSSQSDMFLIVECRRYPDRR